MSKGLPRSLSRGAVQHGDIIKKTIAVDKTIDVVAVSTAIGFGSAVLDGLPEGNILWLGGVANLQFTSLDANIVDAWDGDFGIGSTPASDATITAADVNLQASAELLATLAVEPLTRYAGVVVPFLLDNTDGSLEINLNLLVDAADITDDTTGQVRVEGDYSFAYIVLGDD
jgi:hypothetical protein